jgi:putative oxidoreductase
MQTLLNILNLRFIPHFPNLALLVLRFTGGAVMLYAHGWEKLTNFSSKADQFPDPLGIGSQASLALTIFAEVFCSTLLLLGIGTRFAASALAITIGVAFFSVHSANIQEGELALVYLTIYIALIFTGGGKYAFVKD